MTTKPVANKNGMFDFYEAMEMEDDYAYDDRLWPWSDADYEEGLFPIDLIDSAVPVCWLRVYRCDKIGAAVGLNNATRALIGFKRMTLRQLLGIGDPDATSDDTRNGMERSEFDNDKGNVILNMKESSQPSFFVPASERVDGQPQYDPRCGANFRPSPENPPWPQKDDLRGNKNPMDPYRGMQCVALERDGTCALGDQDFAGFVWVSLKMYVPSRRNCATPHRGGPPILSPFTKYNLIPIAKPEQLKCTDYFGLRVHVYQAKDLPAANPSGVANAFVRVKFCGKSMSTHTVYGSNSPTWDESLSGRNFNEIELPCLGWPGSEGDYETDPAEYKYNPKDEEWDYGPEDEKYAGKLRACVRACELSWRVLVRRVFSGPWSWPHARGRRAVWLASLFTRVKGLCVMCVLCRADWSGLLFCASARLW